MSHSRDIVNAYGIYYPDLEGHIDDNGFCPMTSGAFYMDLYKKINQHPWYPNPNSKPCEVFGGLEHFRPAALSHLGGYNKPKRK